MKRLLVIGALTFAAAGCPAPDPKSGLQSAPVDSALDYNQFVCAAQPVLIKRCSYLACHGNATHALRLYSPAKLRQMDDGVRDDRDTKLTADEVEANFEAAAGILADTTAQQRQQPDLQQVLLLGKPLQAAFGGAEHHGVGIFPAWPAKTLQDDPDWQALAGWVAGAKQPSPVDANCQKLFTFMGLTPR